MSCRKIPWEELPSGYVKIAMGNGPWKVRGFTVLKDGDFP